jgi:hypothetical protein
LKFSVKSDKSFASNASKTVWSLWGIKVCEVWGWIDFKISDSRTWLKYSEVWGPAWPASGCAQQLWPVHVSWWRFCQATYRQRHLPRFCYQLVSVIAQWQFGLR